MASLAQTGLFLLDMDGTFYLGDHLLPGAPQFLQLCRKSGIPFTFLTNNSSKSPADYIAKLAGFGIQIAPEEMFTSGDATLLYLKENGFSTDLLVVGTQSLKDQFIQAGYNPNADVPKAVVLGFDTALNYQTLTALCNAVRSGLPYIATHPDFNCPVPEGYIPDVGAVIAFVKASAGREPDEIIGKPNGAIAKAAAHRAGVPLEKLCMVGDRLYTDIALGRCGVSTALVLSGESTLEDLQKSDVKPDFIFKDLAEMGAALQKELDNP
ncbi:MAG: HAD-IIA family hydrolase [Oscillospiraceae bacterium]